MTAYLVRLMARLGNRVFRRIRLAIPALLLNAGCSLQVLDNADCESNVECEAIFGFGSQCEPDGFCTPGSPLETLSCESTSECLSAGGFGTQCAGAIDGEFGRCATVSTNIRCSQNSLPADLLTGNHAERIVIGVVSDRSVAAHVDRDNAIALAVGHINENSGIGGRSLGLLICDIQSGPQNPYGDGLSRTDAAVQGARWLVEDASVSGLLGPYWSGDAELVYAEVINDADLRGRAVLISPAATDPAVTALDVTQTPTDDEPGLFWRTSSSGIDQAILLAGALDERGITRLAVIREQSPFAGTFMATGQSLAQSLVDQWSGQIEQYSYVGDKSSEREEKVREVGAALAAQQVDAVMFIGPIGDTREFLAQATLSADYHDDLPIFMPDTGTSAEIFAGIEDSRLFNNIVGAQPIPVSSFVLDNFVESFKARYVGVDPLRATYTAHAYDAAWLLSLGLVYAVAQDQSGGYPLINGQDIARGLRKTSTGAGLRFVPSEWSIGVSQLSQGRTVNVEGAASDYAWDLSTEESKGSVRLVTGTSEGTFVPLP